METGMSNGEVNGPGAEPEEMDRRLEDDRIGLVLDIPVQVSVEIGRRRMLLAEVIRLGPGSVVELGKASGEPLDILANGHLIARGEAVVVGERYGVRIIDIVSSRDRLRSLSNEEMEES